MDIYTTHYVYIVDGKEHLNIDAFNSDLDRLFGYPEFDVSNIEAFRDSFPLRGPSDSDSGELFLNSFFDKTVQALLMSYGI